MAQRTTAAGQIWSNLPSADPAPVQRQQPRLADALYPHLRPPQLASPAPTNSYRASTDLRNLAARADADPWLEWRLAMSGLIRRR
jgi:hypothetical protein